MIRKFMKILVGAVILFAIVLLLLVGNISWFTEKSNLEDAEARVALSSSEEILTDKQELESSTNNFNCDSKVSEKFLQDRLEKLKLEYHEDEDFQVLEEKKTVYPEIVCLTPEIESSKIPENSDSDSYTTSSDMKLFGLTRKEYVDKAVQNHTRYTKGISNYTQQDIDILASVIFNEAGCGTTERHKELVAAVVVNRVNSPWVGSSVHEVVCWPNQYLAAYADYDSKYMKDAMAAEDWDYFCEIAEKALRGEVDIPYDVIFQAEFVQGRAVYEVWETSYSTTYFCYSEYTFDDPLLDD